MFQSGTRFKNNPQKISANRRKILEYVIDETMIKVGSEYIWLWVAIASKNKEILTLNMSKEKYVCRDIWFVTELVKIYAMYPVSTDVVLGTFNLVILESKTIYSFIFGENSKR